VIAHYAAVEARVKANPKLSNKLNDSILETVTGLPFKGSYIVLFGGEADSLESNRFTAPQLADSDAEYVYTVRSVSTTPDGVRSLQAEVSAQLTGHKLLVAGRNCSRLRLTDSTYPIQDAKFPLFWADQEFTVISRRSA
jgi:hypothetical protein